MRDDDRAAVSGIVDRLRPPSLGPAVEGPCLMLPSINSHIVFHWGFDILSH